MSTSSGEALSRHVGRLKQRFAERALTLLLTWGELQTTEHQVRAGARGRGRGRGRVRVRVRGRVRVGVRVGGSGASCRARSTRCPATLHGVHCNTATR